MFKFNFSFVLHIKENYQTILIMIPIIIGFLNLKCGLTYYGRRKYINQPTYTKAIVDKVRHA